ncbi:hypothetical protein B7463_g8720, partial [Scytalidium lignicola]
MGSLPQQNRLLCRLVDELAKHKPNQLFCVHPVSSDISEGWRRVTLKDLAHAANYSAWWIKKTIGQSTKFESLAYLGANDIRYVVFVLACMKTGYVALLPSPRNSETAFLHVLNKTGCSKFVCSVERQKQVRELQQVQKTIQAWEIPGLWEIFDSKAEFYPYEKEFKDCEDDPCVIIHSSGTTGFPKPVYLTNGFWSVIDNLPSLPVPPGRCSNALMSSVGEESRSLFIMAPFFHLMGLFVPTKSIFNGNPFILSPEKPMTVDLLARILDETRPEWAFLTPSVIQELASTQRGLDTLKQFEIIFFGGAPLSKEIGDKLCEDITLQSLIGSSEAGCIPNLQVGRKSDWEYFEWNPAYGVDMQHIADGAYEMVLRRDKHRENHGIFHTYPELHEYRTKDLFLKHPTKPDLWRYKGRLDDVLVLSNGEKLNPIEVEKILEGHPLISRALVIGEGRFQPALLVEPSWTEWDGSEPESSFIDQIWPTVQKANKIAPGHGQVLKTKIGLASKVKPFKCTPKGTTQRRLVINDYAEEIDNIYARSDEEYVGKIPENATIEDVMEYIQGIVSGLLSFSQVQETSDIFALGLDSLQTFQLGKILQGAVHSLRPENDLEVITPQKLYSYPSVKELSKYIYGVIRGGTPGSDLTNDYELARFGRITALVEKYTEGLPDNQVTGFNRNDRHAVVLTGSTGSLGNYILRELIKDQTISKVYCLNRSNDAEMRQVKSFEEKGLEIPSDFHHRVEFLQARFGDEKFGLPDRKYEELKQSVDTIIHNAWKVNFNHRVEAFEQTHIEGVRRLVNFSLESASKAHIHFISSISTIEAWSPKHGPSIPEIQLEDPDVAMRQGYGESKFISERICAIASARSGVPTSIYRVGQIAGPTTERGVWNKHEWFPSIVATSKTLKQVPKSLGSMPVDWIPVDSLAKIIVEITRSRLRTETSNRAAAFHLVNPLIASWESLIPAIQTRYEVEPVDFRSWMEALESFSNPTEGDLQDKPALKIMDFCQGLRETEGNDREDQLSDIESGLHSIVGQISGRLSGLGASAYHEPLLTLLVGVGLILHSFRLFLPIFQAKVEALLLLFGSDKVPAVNACDTVVERDAEKVLASDVTDTPPIVSNALSSTAAITTLSPKNVILKKLTELSEEQHVSQMIFEAAARQDYMTCSRLILEGVDCDISGPIGRSLAHVTAMTGNIQLLSILTLSSKRIWSTCSQGKMTLDYAASNNHLETVKYLDLQVLLLCGIDADFKRKLAAKTAYRYALSAYEVEIYKFLVLCGEVKVEYAFKVTADHGNLRLLWWMIEMEGTDFILSEGGADINAPGGLGGSNPMIAAISARNFSIFDYFLSLQPCLNNQHGNFGNILQTASYLGRREILEKILSSDFNINARLNPYGSALIMAIQGGNFDIAKLLISRDADVNLTIPKYGTALHLAAAGGIENIVKLLILAGANVNTEGGDFGTSRQAAAASGRKLIVLFLLDCGAKVNTQGRMYGNALRAAQENGHVLLAKLLLFSGANVIYDVDKVFA